MKDAMAGREEIKLYDCGGSAFLNELPIFA